MLLVPYMLRQALKIWVSISIYEDELEYVDYVDLQLESLEYIFYFVEVNI